MVNKIIDADIWTSHTIIGHSVVDQSGEEIGVIEGVLPDAENRSKRIVVVAFADSFEYHDEVFGVLSSALNFDPDTQRFVLSSAGSQISKTRRISKRRWHEIPYEQWALDSYGVALLDIVSGGQSTRNYFTPEH